MARLRRILLVVVPAIIAMMLMGGTLVSADGNVAPNGFCGGGVAWVIRGQQTLSDPKCAGVFVLEVENKQTRFVSFGDAEKARQGRDATYWFEHAKVVATTVLTTTVTVPAVTGQLAMNWQNFCQGASPLIFTGGGVLNVGLDQVNPPCSGDFRVVEPWRIGCREPVDQNPNCNRGKYWEFVTWAEAVKWLKANGWTEGSVWLLPAGLPALPVVSETATPTSTPTSMATATPTARPPTPTQTPVPSLKGGTLPSNVSSGMKWWGWVLIALGAIALAVGFFFLIRLLRGRGFFSRLSRRRRPPASADPQP